MVRPSRLHDQSRRAVGVSPRRPAAIAPRSQAPAWERTSPRLLPREPADQPRNSRTFLPPRQSRNFRQNSLPCRHLRQQLNAQPKVAHLRDSRILRVWCEPASGGRKPTETTRATSTSFPGFCLASNRELSNFFSALPIAQLPTELLAASSLAPSLECATNSPLRIRLTASRRRRRAVGVSPLRPANRCAVASRLP